MSRSLLVCVLLLGVVAAIPILPPQQQQQQQEQEQEREEPLDVDEPRFASARIADELASLDTKFVVKDFPSAKLEEDDIDMPRFESAPVAPTVNKTENGTSTNSTGSSTNSTGTASNTTTSSNTSSTPSNSSSMTTNTSSTPSSNSSTSNTSSSSTPAPPPPPSSVSNENPPPASGQSTTLSPTSCYKWIVRKPTTQLHDGREDLFTWLDKEEKRMYVLGGCGAGSHISGCTTTLSVQDLSHHSWDTTTISVKNRLWLKATGAAYAYNPTSERVFDFGGARDTGDGSGPKAVNWLATLAFDKATGHWHWSKQATTGTQPPALLDASLTRIGSSVALFGGHSNSVYFNKLYHTYTSGADAFKWTTPLVTGTAPAPRAGHSATTVGNKIYIWGGTDGNHVFDDLHVLEVPANRNSDVWKWSTIVTYNTSAALKPRAFHSTVLLPNNRLFVTGGMNQNLKEYYEDSAILDLTTRYWMGLPASVKDGSKPVAAKKAAAVLANQGREVIVTGGCSAAGCQNIFQPRVFDTQAVCSEGSCVHGSYELVDGLPHCKCTDNWFGKFCSESKKCPKDCSSRGTCEGGVCKCKAGFGGEACEKRVCPNNCTSADRGTCSPTETRCVCKPGFWGLDCSQNACPMNCMGRGICQKAAAAGQPNKCECLEGFSGDGCQFWGEANLAGNASTNTTNTSTSTMSKSTVYKSDYTCPNHCSGHGICKETIAPDGTKIGKCECRPGFGGNDCGGECTLHCTDASRGTCSGTTPLDVKCTCKTGFKGPGCFEKYCANNCSSHGVCKGDECFCSAPFSGGACELDTSCNSHGDFVLGKCKCQEGWGGHSCEQKVNCTDPCQNGGVCVGADLKEGEKVARGVCQCKEGWTGHNCAKKECPLKCSANGVCRDDGTCQCYSSYIGSGCEKALQCPGNCTGTHGTCGPDPDFPGTTRGVCKCAAGWAGPDCNELGCPNACYGRGKCVSGKCDCAEGYSGSSCEVMCPKKCSGKGLCLAGSCKCYPGYAGADCNTTATCPKDPKTGAECSSNGVCFKATGTCFCQPGWSGPACSKQHTCGATGCGQHGTCVNSRCFCDPGWEGKNCEIQARCSQNCNDRGFCLHGSCFCHTGFSGKACENFVKDTRCPKDCNGVGLCQFGRCFCAQGHSGEACESVVQTDKCRKHPTSAKLCEGRGQCRFARCFCDPGFSGDFCDKPEVCPGGCVKGQGVCMLGKCRCLPGFKGPDCSEDLVCEGSPTPCSGHGICLQGTCACDSGYGGAGCEKLLVGGNKTCPNACTDGGVCFLGKCFCVPGRTGKDCSLKEQNACPSGCNGNGACMFGQCFCKPGFAGKSCEQEIKCSKKCLENGVCAYGKCMCVPGWHGKDCDVPTDFEERAKAYERDIAAAVVVSRELRANKTDSRYCVGGCGNHGVCINNRCHCEGAYTGPNCRNVVGGALTHRCGKNCSNNGFCVFGECACKPNYAGKYCERHEPIPCPKNCAGRGVCFAGSCSCEPGWSGASCEKKVTCLQDCSKKGVCVRGVCSCIDGWSGASCNISTTVTPTPTTTTTPTANKTEQPKFKEVRFAEEEAAEFPKAATHMDMHQVAAASRMSYALIGSVSFVAGIVVCVLAQAGWERHKETQRQTRQKKLIQPLLHSIE